MQIFNETRDTWYNYQNELDKVCFQYDVSFQYHSHYMHSERVWMNLDINQTRCG